MCWLGYGSKLSALNAARKAAGQAEVDENDPCIYAMENKSGWRIDGGRWKEICSLVGCLMVIRDIVSSSLKTYVEHHPNSKQDMQSIKIFKKWMLEWASNITLTYKQSEIKKQLDACLDCLAESKARSVDWWKAPDVLTDYLKEHYEPFHKFHFPDISEDSSGEEGGKPRRHLDQMMILNLKRRCAKMFSLTQNLMISLQVWHTCIGCVPITCPTSYTLHWCCVKQVSLCPKASWSMRAQKKQGAH